MNKIFYIKDSTIGNKYTTFETVADLVKYINNLIPRAYNMSRDQYAQQLSELGYGNDDPEGVMLTRAISEQFEIGVIKDGQYIRTDVHTVNHFRKEEYGDVAINRHEKSGNYME